MTKKEGTSAHHLNAKSNSGGRDYVASLTVKADSPYHGSSAPTNDSELKSKRGRMHTARVRNARPTLSGAIKKK